MDNVSLKNIVRNFRLLKFSFGGVWSADNFPRIEKGPRFQIINTSPVKLKGTHWILLVAISSLVSTINRQRKKKLKSFVNIIIWNSLGIPLSFFIDFYKRLGLLYSDNSAKYTIHETASSPHPQSPSSNLCGLYCIYAALKIFEKVGHAYYGNASDRLKATKQLKLILEAAVKNIGLINELNLIRYFNTTLQSNYTLKFL